MFNTNSIYFIHNRNLNTMWNVIKKNNLRASHGYCCLLTKFTFDFVELFKILEQNLKISPNFWDLIVRGSTLIHYNLESLSKKSHFQNQWDLSRYRSLRSIRSSPSIIGRYRTKYYSCELWEKIEDVLRDTSQTWCTSAI
jgi:hypothetical protein